jgi:hypothetical protein
MTTPLGVFRSGRKKAKKMVFDTHELCPEERYGRLPSAFRFMKTALIRFLRSRLLLGSVLLVL